MAYEDIEAWRKIMEAEEAEQKAYDEACEKSAEEAAELDEKEFWECGQREIDPATMGFAECDEDDEIPECGLEEEEDEDDLEEEIDFSQYQLDEADLREPLTAASVALNRPASTADLAAQDAVRLMAEDMQPADAGMATYPDAKTGIFKLKSFLFELDDQKFDSFEVRVARSENSPNGKKSVTPMGWLNVSEFKDGVVTIYPFGKKVNAVKFCEQLKRAGVKKMTDIREIEMEPSTQRPPYAFAELWINSIANMAIFVFKRPEEMTWKQRFGGMFADSEKTASEFLDEAAGGLEELGADGQLEDLDDEEAEKAIEKLEQNDDIPLTDEDWKQIDGMKTVGEKIAFIQKKCEGVDLTPSAQKELDATVDYVIGRAKDDAKAASSADALQKLKDFYRKWLDDPDFREKNGKRVDDPSGRPGPNGEKPKIFVTDPDSEAARQFKALYGQLSGVDKEAFAAWAAQAKSRFVAKLKAPREWDRGGGMAGGLRNGRAQANGRRDMHGVDGDGDDAENPLAQHGFDQAVGAADLADVGDDPAAGEDMYIDVDQDGHQIFSHDGIYKDIAAKTALMAQQAGVTKDELQQQLEAGFRKRKIVNTVLDKGRNDEDLTDYQVEYIFSELTPEQQEEFKQELIDSLPWPVWLDADGNQVPPGTPGAQEEMGDANKQRGFIEYLFRFGKNRRVTLQDLLKQYGVAGDQSGKAGAGTEAGDALVLALIAGLADHYEVDPDESKDLWAHKASQSPSKADVARNVEPRRLVKYLAAKILQDLYDFHADHLFKGMRKEVPQGKPEDADLYREGPDGKMHKVTGKEVEGIKGKKWNDVQKMLRDLLTAIFLKGAIGGRDADRRDATELKQDLKDAIERWNGTDQNRGERHARKLKNYLTPRQLAELQTLVKKVRDDTMDDEDEMWRLCILERMRFGYSENAAREWVAAQLKTKRYRDAENALWLYTQVRAKVFLDGESGNMTRDGIKIEQPVYAQKPEDAEGDEPAEGEE